MTAEHRGHIAMLMFSALVAGSFALGALIADQVSPLVVTVLRFVITVAVLGTFALFQTRPSRADFTAPWRFLALGICLSLYFVLMFEALKTAEPVGLSVEFTLAPIISGIFGFILLGQVFTRRVLLGLLLGASGAIWVIFHGDIARLLDFRVGRGEVLFFIGMSFYALYAPLVRLLKRDEPLILFTFACTLAATLVTIPFAWRELQATDFGAIAPFTWFVICYLAVFASASTFLLIQFASLRLPSVKVMAHTFLVPSWVIVWQFAMGQGLPPMRDMIGVTMTVAALVFLLKSQETKA